MTICLFKSKKFSQLGKYNLINWDEGKFKAMVNGDNGNVTTVPDIMYPDQYWEVIGQNLSVMKTILVNTIRTGPIQWYVCDTCLSPRFFCFVYRIPQNYLSHSNFKSSWRAQQRFLWFRWPGPPLSHLTSQNNIMNFFTFYMTASPLFSIESC